MTIGHFPDGAMSKFFEYDEKCAIREAFYELCESLEPECRTIAEEQYKEFAFANGEEEYRQYGLEEGCREAWHLWILDETDGDKDLKEAMRYAIENKEDFTTLEWIVKKIEEDDLKAAESKAAFDRMMGF